MTLFDSLAIFATVAALAILLCLNGSALASHAGLLDHPGGRKLHHQPTPLMGGLMLLLITLPTLLLTPAVTPNYQPFVIYPILICTALVTILGLIDDRHIIPPSVRLIFCGIFFSIAIYNNADLHIGRINWNGFQNGITIERFSYFVTVLSLVTLVNAVNLADGKNGLVLGLCLGWIFILGVAAPSFLIFPIIILGISVSILLAFNLRGALFLGDGGSYGLAAIIGMLSIYVYQNSLVLKSADQIGLMFMIPVGDMIRLMITRKKRGLSPFSPDRDHLHHMLLDRFSWPIGLIIYLSIVLIPSFISIIQAEYTLTLILITFILYWVIVLISHKQNLGAGSRIAKSK